MKYRNLTVEAIDRINAPARLIPLDSPLYLKRMSKELNEQEAGFYVNGIRFHRARTSKGGSILAAKRHENHGWFDITHAVESIFDAYGQSICASRQP
jgi:hypothetical protein